jgi:hypothetical protein
MRALKAYFLFGLLAPVALCLSACGGGGEEGGTVTAPPASSGEVWTVQNPDDRAAVAGSIVAFVNGVHVMVVDGEQIYAGMTELTTKDGAGGGRTIAFPSGLSADLVPTGQGAELRFSTGEKVAVGSRR